MGENPSFFKDKPDHSVAIVSWHDCQEFVKALNTRFDGLELSLPGEVQWEYACRAGTEGARYSDDLDAIAWYDNNSGERTHPVGLKQPNRWGFTTCWAMFGSYAWMRRLVITGKHGSIRYSTRPPTGSPGAGVRSATHSSAGRQVGLLGLRGPGFTTWASA